MSQWVLPSFTHTLPVSLQLAAFAYLTILSKNFESLGIIFNFVI